MPQWSLGNLRHPGSLSIPTSSNRVVVKACSPWPGLTNILSNLILGFLGYGHSRLSFIRMSHVNSASLGLPHCSQASTMPLGSPPIADTSASRRFVSPPNTTVASPGWSVMHAKTCASCLLRSSLHFSVLSRCEVIRIISVLSLNIAGWQSKWRPIWLDEKCVLWWLLVGLTEEFFSSIMLKYAPCVGPHVHKYLKMKRLTESCYFKPGTTPTGLFLENFKIKTCWTVAQFLAYKLGNFAPLTNSFIVSLRVVIKSLGPGIFPGY